MINVAEKSLAALAERDTLLALQRNRGRGRAGEVEIETVCTPLVVVDGEPGAFGDDSSESSVPPADPGASAPSG